MAEETGWEPVLGSNCSCGNQATHINSSGAPMCCVCHGREIVDPEHAEKIRVFYQQNGVGPTLDQIVEMIEGGQND